MNFVPFITEILNKHISCRYTVSSLIIGLPHLFMLLDSSLMICGYYFLLWFTTSRYTNHIYIYIQIVYIHMFHVINFPVHYTNMYISFYNSIVLFVYELICRRLSIKKITIQQEINLTLKKYIKFKYQLDVLIIIFVSTNIP